MIIDSNQKIETLRATVHNYDLYIEQAEFTLEMLKKQRAALAEGLSAAINETKTNDQR